MPDRFEASMNDNDRDGAMCAGKRGQYGGRGVSCQLLLPVFSRLSFCQHVKMQNDEETVAMDDYYEALNTSPLRSNLSQKVLMTSQWVQIMIQRITAAESVVEKQGYASLHESIKSTLLTYFVDFSNEVSVLVKRPVPGIENRSSTIVPLENSHLTIKKAHLATDHGNPKEMQEWLAKNYLLVHEMCAKVYYELCSRCNAEDKLNDHSELVASVQVPNSDDEEGEEKDLDQMLPPVESLDHKCSVDIMDISQKPDNNYKYLLIYKDEKTNFIQLRPLNDCNEADIAVELVKILMDFGPPECISVDEDNVKLFQLILKRVDILSNTKIQLAKHKADSAVIKQVAQNIVHWMNKTSCTNWGTGCHVVQWEMNNLDEDGKTPFYRVFGYKYTGFGYKSKYSAGSEFESSETLEEVVDQVTEDTEEKDAYLVTITEDVVEAEDPLLEIKSENSPTSSNIQYESADE